jgi:hypothetical protein
MPFSPCEICCRHSVTGFLSEFFGFPLSVPFRQCSILIFIHMLLLPEGQTGGIWEPSESNTVLETGGHCIERYFHFFRRYSGKNQCGWTLFCQVLKSFIEVRLQMFFASSLLPYKIQAFRCETVATSEGRKWHEGLLSAAAAATQSSLLVYFKSAHKSCKVLSWGNCFTQRFEHLQAVNFNVWFQGNVYIYLDKL